MIESIENNEQSRLTVAHHESNETVFLNERHQKLIDAYEEARRNLLQFEQEHKEELGMDSEA